MTYAKRTTVNAEKSRAEIERTLTRYGADQFMYGWQKQKAVVGFRLANRQIKFFLSFPDQNDPKITHHSRGRRTAKEAQAKYDQVCRQKWRALVLTIKAKLEAVESGISIFEEEFLANIVLPDGGTVSQFMLPQIAKAYESGDMPKLLPHL